jgi:glycosyltransferase involved in cell wall biosynthesis
VQNQPSRQAIEAGMSSTLAEYLEKDFSLQESIKVAVIIPCFNVEEHIKSVIEGIPEWVSYIIPVNDGSRDSTAQIIDSYHDDRIFPVQLPNNQGVGGAVIEGFRKACELHADIFVKMDGDGQMDPDFLPFLLDPLIEKRSDYAKGNRFRYPLDLTSMPFVRRLGNSVLSFIVKAASGYWDIFDPTNGYLAIRREVFEIVPVKLIGRRYFFESSMLITLGMLGAVVMDVPLPAVYGSERSHLKILPVIIEFPFRMLIGMLRRFWYRKIMYTLAIEAILFLFGLLFILAGFSYGGINFYKYAIQLIIPAPSGTVMASALPILLGFQMVINAIVLDIQSVPKIPLCKGGLFPYMKSSSEV